MVFFDDSGETNGMRYARGVLAAIIFFALTGTMALKIILLPARETGLATVKETRTLDLPHDFATDATVWNVVLVSTYLSPVLHLIRNIILTRTIQHRRE
jgi:hypothetical protein